MLPESLQDHFLEELQLIRQPPISLSVYELWRRGINNRCLSTWQRHYQPLKVLVF